MFAMTCSGWCGIDAVEKMVEEVRNMGVGVDTVVFEASHSPFLSMPDGIMTACHKAVVSGSA